MATKKKPQQPRARNRTMRRRTLGRVIGFVLGKSPVSKSVTVHEGHEFFVHRGYEGARRICVLSSNLLCSRDLRDGVLAENKEGPQIVLAGHPTVPARAPSGPASVLSSGEQIAHATT